MPGIVANPSDPAAEQQRATHVARVVDAIEYEMRRLQLWGEEPPAVAAMASRTPFCYDTLKLLQWLQWIFVPRMRLILTGGEALPQVSDISPLAELEFRRLNQDTSRLLALILRFDRLITVNSDEPPRSLH